MKLRIRGNSIRMRVTRSELDEIAATGVVRDRIEFGGGARLDYVLMADPVAEAPAARLADGVITISVPRATVRDWARSEMVSIRAEQPVDDGESLGILVEKDFACLKPREGEDESDMFEHPAPEGANC